MGVTAYSFFHCPEQDIKRLKFICKGGINLKFFRFMPCFEANGVGGAGGEGTTEPNTGGEGTTEPNTDDFERLLKARLDEAMEEERKKNAKLSKELEKMKREKLTADELKKYDDEKRESELAEREHSVMIAENKLYAIEQLKEIGLDDGSKESMGLIDLILSEDREKIKSNIKALDTIIKAKVKSEVEKVFKDNSRVPEKSGSNGYTTNPYAKETFNLTEQMKLEVENPELASKLQSLVKR
nr:MAG TPA: capsid scaffolding protein [Caudoviricetes sp.]